VGPQIAEHLGLVNISYAEDVRVEDDCVVVKRQFEDRYHIIKAKMPCLITALSEMCEPRYMTPGGIFDAYRSREIKTLVRSDLKIDDDNIGLKGSPTRVVKSFTKEVKGKGTVVALDAHDAVDWITDRLQEKFIL
jgi:electron transfer flavoprotein beta subunit